ncbi:MAG TPA: DUF4270 domain-containing protein [Flavobacterium sp.]|uniref:DUF4270 domain-containing protein n=1 Tax=Flavobacterium sp. TaxID=239 RepID=UPI002C570373|nr:DUF4270 domain-containing protein [Flavobacterium sp.]HSD14470.1 DUF4270 domain-containing protein [Flavobacterium sp.]
MNKLSLVKRILLLVPVVFFASCDKEFNTIGADIVGKDYFQFKKDSFEVKTNNFLTGPVQTNNLTLNSLGTYTDPKFGETTSHFVTQVEMQNTTSITVNTNAVIDSVWVYVPFFSHQTGTDDNGIREFMLDSIYPNPEKAGVDLDNNKFKLKVYENGYYLGSYNPNNAGGVERHYSDEKNKVDNVKLGAGPNNVHVVNGAYLNNSSEHAENEEFFFNNEERIIYKTNGQGLYLGADGEELDDEDQGDISKRVVKERFVPGIWLNLNKEYFKKRILQAPISTLKNNNVFKEYFRGLYFEVEQIPGGSGALASLDFSKGFIRITYNMDTATDNDNNPQTPTPTRLKRFLQMKLGGNCINFFDNNHTLPTNADQMCLKGGNGSVAYIDLFGEDGPDDGIVPDQLDALRTSGWLINEANLTFYIDDNDIDGMGKEGQIEPNRLYLYDFKNKKPIVDYLADGSTNSSNPKNNKRGFGGIIEKENGKGVKYKLRLTEYLKSVIKHADSTNYRLGIAVSESINITTNAYLKPASGQQPDAVVPLSSVLSPLGTILFNENIPQPLPGTPNNHPDMIKYKKRLKLEIYYTKPD